MSVLNAVGMAYSYTSYENWANKRLKSSSIIDKTFLNKSLSPLNLTFERYDCTFPTAMSAVFVQDWVASVPSYTLSAWLTLYIMNNCQETWKFIYITQD